MLRGPALGMPDGNAVSLRARVTARLAALVRAEARECAQRFRAAGTGVCSALLALEVELQVLHCLLSFSSLSPGHRSPAVTEGRWGKAICV